jgi:hypothetical protein
MLESVETITNQAIERGVITRVFLVDQVKTQMTWEQERELVEYLNASDNEATKK